MMPRPLSDEEKEQIIAAIKLLIQAGGCLPVVLLDKDELLISVPAHWFLIDTGDRVFQY